jgi:hypothetical protein
VRLSLPGRVVVDTYSCATSQDVFHGAIGRVIASWRPLLSGLCRAGIRHGAR